MSEAAREERKHYTYADLEALPRGERWEIIDGVLYDMSAAPARRHQQLSTRLAAQLLALGDRHGCETYHAPFDVRLPEEPAEGDDEVDTVVEPDIVVVCDRDKLDERGCRGAPELVVEIMSPRSSYRDQTEKLALYERCGVHEYWVVNPDAGWVMVYRRSGSSSAGFAKPSYYRSDESVPVGVLGEVEISLPDVFRE